MTQFCKDFFSLNGQDAILILSLLFILKAFFGLRGQVEKGKAKVFREKKRPSEAFFTALDLLFMME